MEKKDKENRIDLLNGSISGALFWLSLPIMGSQFVQMAYNLFDTMWVGQIGNQAVTAVGAAGSFMWIGQGIAMIPQVGGQIEFLTWMTGEGFSYSMSAITSQNYGAGNYGRVRKGFLTGAAMMTVFGILVTALLVLGAAPIFGLFIHEPDVIAGGAGSSPDVPALNLVSILKKCLFCQDGIFES